MCVIVFFKQKTAYDMRISDWSSDVCSSDLPLVQTVAVPIIGATEGQQFQVKLREAPWGDLQGQSTATITASSTAMATARATGTFRAPRSFAATGTLQFELRKDTHRRSPDGGWDRWATSLAHRSEEHTSELQSLMRTSYAVF